MQKISWRRESLSFIRFIVLLKLFKGNLHEISGFRTDFEIVSNRNMRKIFTLMKKEEK